MKKILLLVFIASVAGVVSCKKRGEIVNPELIIIDSVVCGCKEKVLLNKVYITAHSAPETVIIGTPAKASKNDYMTKGEKPNRFVYYSYRDDRKFYQIYLKNQWYSLIQNIFPDNK